MCDCLCSCVEVRGQFCGNRFSRAPCKSWTQIIRLAGRHHYRAEPSSHSCHHDILQRQDPNHGWTFILLVPLWRQTFIFILSSTQQHSLKSILWLSLFLEMKKPSFCLEAAVENLLNFQRWLPQNHKTQLRSLVQLVVASCRLSFLE